MAGPLITVAATGAAPRDDPRRGPRVPLHTLLSCACWVFAIASSRVNCEYGNNR